MAEQEVRPRQLSIAEIARLWSAETGDSAEVLERELAEWAYAATADGAQIGPDPSDRNERAPAALKIEPDPNRELRWDDLEEFCRERDRLLPHFWPEPGEAAVHAGAPGTAAPSGPTGSAPDSPAGASTADDRGRPSADISRLVVRAVDRMGPAPLMTVTETRAQASGAAAPSPAQQPQPAEESPAAEPADNLAEPAAGATQAQPRLGNLTLAASKDASAKEPDDHAFATAATRIEPRLVRAFETEDSTSSEAKTAANARSRLVRRAKAADKSSLKALDAALLKDTDLTAKAGPKDTAELDARDRRASVVRALRNAKKQAAAPGETPPNSEADRRSTDQKPASRKPATLKDVPVRVTRPAPSLAAVRPHSVGGGAWSGMLGGVLVGALLAGAATAAWVELKGPGLRTVLLGEQVAGPEVAALKQRLSEATQRATAAAAESERLSTQLADSGRQLDTLRARIADISSLGERLTEAQRSNTAMRGKIAELTEALDVARGGGDAARQAMQKELAAAKTDLVGAQEAVQTAEKEAARLTGALATAQGEIEAAKLARLQLERQAAALSADLTAARDDAENLTQSSAAAQAVAQRFEGDLTAAKKDLEAQIKRSAELESKIASQSAALAGAQGRARDLDQANAAAVTETRRLGAALDAAKSDMASLQAAAERAGGEIARLSAVLVEVQRDAKKLDAEKTAVEGRAAGLEKDLSLALKSNSDLRAETDNLDSQAAQLTDFLAAAREEIAALSASRTAAIARANTLSADLAGAEAESKTLRGAIDGSSDASARLAAELAAAERRVASLEEDQRTALAQIDALNLELAETREAANAVKAAAGVPASPEAGDASRLAEQLAAANRRAEEQSAEREIAQRRLEALVGTLAAARSEIRTLEAGARQANEERNWLLEAVESWKDESRVLAASLAAAEKRAQAAGLKVSGRSDETKEDLIGPARNVTGAPVKLLPDAETQLARGGVLAPDMIRRGRELLSRGDVAAARRAFRRAAELGDPAALTAIAQTYDPRVLQGLGVLEAFASPETAERLYERALVTGDPIAGNQLEAMRAWLRP